MMRFELRRIAQGTLTYGLGEVLNRVISFLLLPVFTAYLSPKDYGISAILGLITFLAVPVFSLGFGTALAAVYFEDRDRARRDSVIWTALLVLGISVAIMILLGWRLDHWLSVAGFGEAGYEWLILLSLLTGACTILTTPLRLRLQFEERARLYVVVSSTATLLSIISSIIMVVVLERGILGFVEGNLIGQALTFILFSIAVLPTVSFSVRLAVLPGLLRIGIATIPGFAFLFLLQQANRYILRTYDGLDAVGIYTIGYNLGFVMNIFVSGFTNAWTPYFLSFSDRLEEAKNLFGSIFSYYVRGFGVLSLLFYAAAGPVVLVMTQPGFHDAYTVVGLTATGQFLIGVFSMFLAPVYFAKEVPMQTLVQGAAALLSLGLTIFLVAVGGYFGAGVSLALGFFLLAALQYAWNARRGKRYLRISYDWRPIIRFSLFYLVFASALLIPRRYSLSEELLLTGFSTLTLIVSFLFIFVTTDERKAALSLARDIFSGGKS